MGKIGLDALKKLDIFMVEFEKLGIKLVGLSLKSRIGFDWTNQIGFHHFLILNLDLLVLELLQLDPTRLIKLIAT